MNTKTNNKGFTLVELSIVLVIIGLLIGGILVAQSMIGTARLQSGVRQLGQFDAAVANFFTKYNSLPGDNAIMGADVGDNNGYVMDADGTAVPTKFDEEIGKFWSDLSQSGLKPTGTAAAYTDGSATMPVTGNLVNVWAPQFPLGTNIAIIAAGKAGAATDGNGAPGNYYIINAFTAGALGALTTSSATALKPADAAAIDAKIDDGYATNGTTGSGSVLAIDAGVVRAAPAGTTCATFTTTVATIAYQTSTAATGCGLAVRFGIQTGNLQ